MFTSQPPAPRPQNSLHNHRFQFSCVLQSFQEKLIPTEIEENAYAKSNKCSFKIFLPCFKSFE